LGYRDEAFFGRVEAGFPWKMRPIKTPAMVLRRGFDPCAFRDTASALCRMSQRSVLLGAPARNQTPLCRLQGGCIVANASRAEPAGGIKPPSHPYEGRVLSLNYAGIQF
jgi:hypothetical protein